MNQETRWLTKYNEVVDFIQTNQRNPSHHRIEDHDMLNWLKATRKKINAGELKPERLDSHKKLVPMQPGDVPMTYADAEVLERDYGFTPKITPRRRFTEVCGVGQRVLQVVSSKSIV